jgi:DNA-binding winged helix-turn-helix (wHTH) protein
MKTTSRTAFFGPYEVDVRSGEVQKHGVRLKMGEQPFQILLMLLASPGELVLREELRARLWANDTFVDFDHGLNSAVQRLRDCLSDTAEKPRWIETIPRRGYRFIGQVTFDQEIAGSAIAKILQNSPQAISSHQELPKEQDRAVETRSRNHRDPDHSAHEAEPELNSIRDAVAASLSPGAATSVRGWRRALPLSLPSPCVPRSQCPGMQPCRSLARSRFHPTADSWPSLPRAPTAFSVYGCGP